MVFQLNRPGIIACDRQNFVGFVMTKVKRACLDQSRASTICNGPTDAVSNVMDAPGVRSRIR